MKTLLVVGLVAGTAWAQAEKQPAADVKIHVLEERDAGNLVKLPGSAVLHNVGAYLGAGFVF